MDYKNGTQGHESNDNDDNDQLPEIDVLGREDVPKHRTSSIGIGRKDDLTQRMAEQVRTIRELTQQLQQTQEELNDSARNQYELNSLLQATMSTPGMKLNVVIMTFFFQSSQLICFWAVVPPFQEL